MNNVDPVITLAAGLIFGGTFMTIVVGAFARLDIERVRRDEYARGRTAAFEEMGRGCSHDAGARLLDEIAAEFAENNHHL